MPSLFGTGELNVVCSVSSASVSEETVLDLPSPGFGVRVAPSLFGRG